MTLKLIKSLKNEFFEWISLLYLKTSPQISSGGFLLNVIQDFIKIFPTFDTNGISFIATNSSSGKTYLFHTGRCQLFIPHHFS